jgi:uncharacterized protein
MSDLENLGRLPDDFSGVVRVFPLPSMVLFPHVMQPLHIFEPRYCDMLADAMATDKLIAMGALAEGWQTDYQGKPPILPPICIGKIITHTPTEDDRHNILLLGVRRARIVSEIETDQSFRTARVELIDDVYRPELASTRNKLQKRLLDSFRRLIPETALAQENFRQLLASRLPLGAVTDIVSFTCAMPLEIKLELLSEADVDLRAQRLLEVLNAHLPVLAGPPASKQGRDVPFPPPFSLN